MAQPQLNLFQVEVTFHPEALDSSGPLFTYVLDGVVIPPDEIMSIPVPSGIAMIVFSLGTQEGSEHEAFFQTYPIQWFKTDSEGNKTNTPLPIPGSFSFERTSDKLLKLFDFNANLSKSLIDTNHWFNLVVTYDGKTYGSDPSIVNQPPIDG